MQNIDSIRSDLKDNQGVIYMEKNEMSLFTSLSHSTELAAVSLHSPLHASWANRIAFIRVLPGCNTLKV